MGLDGTDDPVQRVYKDTFMLFYDPLGGDRFGGVWDPRLEDPRPFKILNKFSSIPVSKVDVASLHLSLCTHIFPRRTQTKIRRWLY